MSEKCIDLPPTCPRGEYLGQYCLCASCRVIDLCVNPGEDGTDSACYPCTGPVKECNPFEVDELDNHEESDDDDDKYPVIAQNLNDLSTKAETAVHFIDKNQYLDDISRVAVYSNDRDELYKIAECEGGEAFWCPICQRWSYAPNLLAPACNH